MAIKHVENTVDNFNYGGQFDKNQKDLGIKTKDQAAYERAVNAFKSEIIDQKEGISDQKEAEDQAQESFKKLSTYSQKIREFINSQSDTLKERIKKGEDGPSIQIGKKSMTAKEWELLMKKVDDELEAIKRLHEKEKQEKEKAAQQEKLDKHKEENEKKNKRIR